jgi:preprotein translocase subunit SecE
LKKAMAFLRDVRSELAKVTWPGRQELISSTGVVMFSVILVSVFIGIVDLGLSRILGLVLR